MADSTFDAVANAVDLEAQKALNTVGAKEGLMDLHSKMMDPEKRHQLGGTVAQEMNAMLKGFNITVDEADIASFGIHTKAFDMIQKDEGR